MPELSLEDQIKALTKKVRLLEQDVEETQASNSILKAALEKYADKNFWIRVPPYTLAQADKGYIAQMALAQAGGPDEDETA